MTRAPSIQLPSLATETQPEPYAAFTVPATFGESVPMLELILRTGDRVGLAYAWLGPMTFRPPTIELVFTYGVVVTICGRHLDPLFAALLRHQAVSIVEADAPTVALVPESLTLVETIQVEAKSSGCPDRPPETPGSVQL